MKPLSGLPQPEVRQNTPSHFMRRGFLLGAMALVAGGAIGAARWYNISAEVTGGDLTALEALTAVQNGEITLVDIRRPDEWHRTGIGQGAIAIDMRQQDFIDVLVEKNRGNMAAPVALICARGVRSRRMLKRLQDAGFTNILDVPEGMLGSGAGPGWLERGLPVVRP